MEGLFIRLMYICGEDIVVSIRSVIVKRFVLIDLVV